MRKKILFTMMVTFIAAFCLVGSAMAAQQVTNFSDKPIEPKSSCSQAGSISLQFPINTTMHEGDTIRYLLSSGAKVCGNIDYFLQLANNGQMVVVNGAGDPVQVTNNNAGLFDIQVLQDNAALVAGALTVDGGAGDAAAVGLLVSAVDGADTISMTLARKDLVTNVVSIISSTVAGDHAFAIQYVANDPNENLTIKFFDKNNLAAFFFEPADRLLAPTVYDDDIADAGDTADNVLCVNTVNYTGSSLYAIPESRPVSNLYQMTFLGDFIVQQLVSAVNYKVETVCKDAICNLIPLVASVDQQGNNVPANGKFDFGTYTDAFPLANLTVDRWSSTGYCGTNANLLGNGVIFYKDGATFSAGDQFKVTMTVRVGSLANGQKITFDAAEPTDYLTVKGNGPNCNSSDNPGAANSNFAATAASTAWAFAGVPAANQNTVISGTYTIVDNKKGALMFDLPALTMTLANVTAGEKVFLDITVSKLPCGGPIASNTICLGELVNTCPFTVNASIDGIAFIGDPALTRVLHGYLARQAAGNALFFPYAPAMESSDFFTGISIDNTGATAVNLTVLFKDANGGTATYTQNGLAAGNMWVTTLDALMGTPNFVDGVTPLDTTQSMTVNVTAVTAQ